MSEHREFRDVRQGASSEDGPALPVEELMASLEATQREVATAKDDELLAYRPMPETIGSAFTTLYYMRRSYEEGLAAFGWAGERFAASTNCARMMYEGMRDHYGVEVPNFAVHAYAEVDHGDAADFLLRQVVQTAGQQRRVRRAIEPVLTLRNARTVATHAWLVDAPALRS